MNKQEKEVEEMKILTSMRLNETHYPDDLRCSLYIRVPGGWIFQTRNASDNGNVNSSTFIPLCLQV